MARGTVNAKDISCKFPKYQPTSVVIGDSHCKHLHHHFNPGRKGTPAFISQSGAKIVDACSLLDFVPATTTAIVLHVGTNDMAQSSAEEAFGRYRTLLDVIARDFPSIKRVYATLILPRSINRRRGGTNRRFVGKCNREAARFNGLLRRHCRQTRGLFFLDHGFQWLPPARVLAADGLHPSFEGVAILASHLHQTLRRGYGSADDTWQQHSAGHTAAEPAPTSPPPAPASPAAESRASAQAPSDPAAASRSPAQSSGKAPSDPAASSQAPSEPRYNLRKTFSAVVNQNRRN